MEHQGALTIALYQQLIQTKRTHLCLVCAQEQQELQSLLCHIMKVAKGTQSRERDLQHTRGSCKNCHCRRLRRRTMGRVRKGAEELRDGKQESKNVLLRGLDSRSRPSHSGHIRLLALMDWTMFSFLVGTTLLPVAAGGHYHYATLSWERVGVGGSMGFETYVAGTHIVDITLRSAWSTEFSPYKDRSPGGVVSVGTTLRLTGTGNTVLYFGDGDESFESVNSRVLYVDDAIKSWRGEAVLRHAYPAAQRYRAYFSGCCRDAAVANSATGTRVLAFA